MNRNRSNRGFTMAEMMITVAILAVLAGLAFVGVARYRKNMHQLEMDAIAKQIFIAAQNHLSTAEGQGFLNLNPVSNNDYDVSFGQKEKDKDGQYTGVYFFVYGNGSDNPNNTNSLLSYMLPIGSVDDTARLGGSYVIRYQKSPAVILDVFYSSEVVFNGDYTDYNKLFNINQTPSKAYTGDNKRNRQNYDGTDKIIGWYGGENAQSGVDLKAPSIQVRNAEILEVIISDSNPVDSAKYKHQLIVKGQTSGKTAVLDYDPTVGKLTLDNICVISEHFTKHSGFGELLPGENISVQAKVFSTSVLTNVATSELKITNSLFDDATSIDNSSKSINAVISNIRHLENLSSAISGCGTTALKVDVAVQTADLKWSEFRNADSIKNYTDWSIVALDGSNPKDTFRPVFPANAINYNGGYHSISSGTADTVPINETTGNVGLFGTLTGSTVKNLELINFSVTGGESSKVGTLVGYMDGSSTIENVLSRHEINKDVAVSGGAKSVVGGLIGEANGGTMTACAAAVRVSGTTAGGLIGTSSGTVTGCYSAGHVKTVKNGENVLAVRYDDAPASFDVIGQTAGGLIGSNSGPVSCSYSTCSVYSNSEDRSTGCAGGFVGSLAKGGSISNCYSTGLVKQATGELTNTGVVNNAFVGATAAASQAGKENKYFKIINEVPIYKEGSTTDIKEFMYKAAGGPPDADNDASAFDETAESYNAFVPSTWMNARPYEGTLVGNKWISVLADYYQNKYIFPTVSQLGAKINNSVIPVNYYVNTHYGDWPAPEIFVVNTTS